MRSKNAPHSCPQARGFALVVSLTMMILLTVIAVGLLSLSAITLRTTTQSSAKAEAQANARLALMIAIGELQKQMGPDQRISANGDIITNTGVNHPHFTGVWDSWVAGPLTDAPVNPDYPSAESHHQTIGAQSDASMRPNYSEKSQHFRTWLASLDPEEATDPTTPVTLNLDGVPMPDNEDSAIRLVSIGSLGDNAFVTDFVSARLMEVESSSANRGPRGRYAWWVGDESQKARVINDSYHGESLTSSDKIFRAQAPASTGTTTIAGLAGLDAAQQARLEGLPTLSTLDLVPGVQEIDDGGTFRASQKGFHSVTPFSRAVLADVREGGLKRDLSTLLERPIDPTERSDEFMLYKFDVKDAWANDPELYPTLPNTPQEAVPIQDLAAFYQLYDRSRKAGIEYAADSIRLSTPDFGTTTDYTTKFQQDYTTLYRNPVPIKIQYLVSLLAEPITAADRDIVEGGVLRNSKIPLTDTLKLRLAVMPAITLWNPYNVPIVMETGDQAQQIVVKPPAFMFQCEKRRSGSSFTTGRLNLNFATSGSSVTTGSAERRTDLIRLNFGRLEAIPFEPGEVKVFSLPFNTSGQIINYDPRHLHVENNLTSRKNLVDASAGWNPDGYYTLRNSTPAMRQQWYGNSNFETHEIFRNVLFERVSNNTYDVRWSLTMDPTDELAFTIIPENTAPGQNVSGTISPYGAAMCFYMGQRNFTAGGYNFLNLRHNGLVSQMTAIRNPLSPSLLAFNQGLLTQGMPGQAFPMVLEAIRASTIANATSAGEPMPFVQFALMAGCETGELANGGIAGGRKFPSRPFLHSSPIQPNVIDRIDETAPYNHGWNWWMDEMNSVLESLVQESRAGNGFYGGGFSTESGTTHVVQQEVPVTPPISIAALSHARIGGFTLANEAPVGEGFTGTSQMESAYGSTGRVDNPSTTLGFQRVTATGQGGLYPHVLQAIGNSYANPNLAAGVAYNPAWKRHYIATDGERDVTFADHSYLANKALWDEYFFSSITPQPSNVEIFGTTDDRDAKQVAMDFFFDAKPLPNRRIVPHMAGMTPTELDALFLTSETFTNGLADKIAGHLMVEGPFNINSTSVEAWKVLFSSLKGKPVAYLDGGKVPMEADSGDNVPVGMGTLPAGLPATTADTADPRDPEQWKGLRVINEDEIDALAQAMVREVRKRGPFLSLSEFINRRLAPDNTGGMALKGALQAALDYDGSDDQGPEVTINRNFRSSNRTLDAEVSGIDFAFPDAARGPAAYGSSAYVDQADVLRHFAEQLTPRGDTFVIRTYGDALDHNGKVLARAWCEAVVQRTPDYVDATDDNHTKAADLVSDANRRFGRFFVVISFRWLNSSEI